MTQVNTEMIPREFSPEVIFFESCERHRQVEISRYRDCDKVGERFVAVLMLIPALPFIALLALLVRCTSKGPGLFTQERVGRNGKVYTMYKLRSMRCDAEDATGPVWSTPSDDRTTLIGKLLRKLHLDELPQLLNIMKGEMSFVGPRPERPEFVSVLEEQVPGYCERLRVLPGVTGLAQVNLPPDTSVASVRDKVALDVEYIKTASFFLDLRIILCTALKMLCIPSDLRLQITGVSRQAPDQGMNGAEHKLTLTPDHLRQNGSNGHNGRQRASSRLPHRPR